MLRKYLSLLRTNVPGWHTTRKIVVFDSDDWGSIRMPDKATYDKLLYAGIRVDQCPYNRYDTLASEEDLSSLFEVLSSFTDFYGNHPIITANCVVTNPDFNKIRESGFNTYQYEWFPVTLQKYPNHSRSFQLWKEGMERKLFHPEFHGREHLHVSRWMQALKQNLPETRLAFDLKLFGLSTIISNENRKSYLAAYDVNDIEGLDQIKAIIFDGLSIFKQIFGYTTKTFIAPNYTWPTQIEQSLSEWNIRYLKGAKVQSSPIMNSSKNKRIRHYTGQRNSHNQIHIERNCEFEPSFNNGKDSVDKCLAQIENAFNWKKPAILTVHRLNFIGGIEKYNRERTLILLGDLLKRVFKKWPDVEFMTAERVGELISKKNPTTESE
jgi:hypothetical protein